jgi:hypothetical protein
MIHALDPITIVVMIVATIVTMTVIGMNAMINTDVIAPGHLLAVASTMIAGHPGLRPPGGRLMIKGLQGTKITGAEAMMTAERLIIIMIAVGMIKIAAETTKDATTKKIGTTTGQGMRMVKDGRVEVYCKGRVQEKRMASHGFLLYWTSPIFVVLSFTRTVYFSIGWSTPLEGA